MEKNIGDNMSENNLQYLKCYNKLTEAECKMMSPLQLAYIGDAIYEVFVRTHILMNNNKNVNRLHRLAIKYVKADAQAKFYHEIQEYLTEDERRIVKRGRNSKVATVPKNANLTDYKYATGFESLIGYLYLTGNTERLEYIYKLIMDMKI